MTTYKALMWTGAGVGIAGLVLTITGGVLAANNDITVKLDDFDKSNGTATKDLSAKNTMPHALLGAGIGMTVVGAVVAGFTGYQVTHFKTSDEIDVSFNMSPTAAGLNIVF